MISPLDPDYWLKLGITPIVINPSDTESIEQGMQELTQQIQKEVKKQQATDSEKLSDG